MVDNIFNIKDAIQVIGDALNPARIFALTREPQYDLSGKLEGYQTNVVIFEIKPSMNKMSAEEYKIKGKIRIQHSNPFAYVWIS